MTQPGRRVRRRARRGSFDWQSFWQSKNRQIIGLATVLAVVVIGLVIWQNILVKPSIVKAEPTFEAVVLEQEWQDIIRQYERVAVGIEVWDVDSDSRASVNSLEVFRAASVTKLITAAYALSMVEKEQLHLSERLADQTTLYWHLEQMVRWSSNDSWRKIRDRLDRPAEQSYARELGLSSFDLTENTVSTDDMARFLLKLAKGELISQGNVDLLESYMTDTYEERFLAAAAPKEATVYHKAGTLEDDVHEAAIIDYKGRTYVMVIMTNGGGISAFDIRANLFKELVDVFFAEVDRERVVDSE